METRSAASINALNQRTSTVYDAAGESIASIDPLGRRSSTIYDMAGRRVRSLASGAQSPGQYTVQWDGRSDLGVQMAPGAYFLRARVAGAQQVTRVIYLKQ